MIKYTHLKLNQDIAVPAGHYTPEKESVIKIDGREILYVLSSAVVDSSCCGNADYTSALVPGYIISQDITKDKDGLAVSEVEPITDKATRGKIRKIIRETENISQVEFW
ncbi:MAG TPA: hypothetical protein G4O16_10730 [Dehalococcoidia bacterium]|nr:hypothetical protein [Dehalococcoidia bacterium]